MHVVMNALADRGLIFVDSKTIGHSVAERIAAEHGLDHAGRDVFLDHEDNINFVRKALLELERVARRNGSAIAIGHPKAATIQGLKEWLPLAEQRGFVVVPVSAVVKRETPKIEATKVVFGPAAPKAFPALEPFPLQSPRP